jgi:hypothetical protein
MKLSLLAGAAALGWVAAVTSAQAQDTYAATAKTVTVDTGDLNTSPTANRLFLDAAFTVPAPIGTAVWFVADPSGNGLPASAIPGASGDDIVLHKDAVDGSLPFNKVGQFQRVGIAVANAYAQADIYVILWNGQGAGFEPTSGSQYGVLKLGVRPPPTTGSGNASWSITENVSATQFTVGGGVEPNRPPQLAVVEPQVGGELTPITFTLVGSDPDAGQTLNYSLEPGAPATAQINATTGAFTWTPSEAEGPGTFEFQVRVTDNGSPALSAVRPVTIQVLEANTPPSLAAVPPVNGKVGVPLTLQLNGSDTDLPVQTLAYRLADPLPGALLNPATGFFEWTPGAAQAGNVPVRFIVSDSGSPGLEGDLVVQFVIAPNQVPTLAEIAPVSGPELAALTFTASGADADAGQTLTYSLGAGAPAGALIDPTTGVFTWTPGEADGPGTFPVVVRVTDNGLPPQFAERTVTLTVTEANVAPVLAAIPSGTGKVGTLLTFTLQGSDTDLPKQTLTYRLVTALEGASVDPATGVFTWTPTAAQVGTRELRFAVQDSASPALEAEQVATFEIAPDDLPVASVVSVALVGDSVRVRFSTQSGRSYTVETQESLGAAGWTALGAAVTGTGSPIEVVIPSTAGVTLVRVAAR